MSVAYYGPFCPPIYSLASLYCLTFHPGLHWREYLQSTLGSQPSHCWRWRAFSLWCFGSHRQAWLHPCILFLPSFLPNLSSLWFVLGFQSLAECFECTWLGAGRSFDHCWCSFQHIDCFSADWFACEAEDTHRASFGSIVCAADRIVGFVFRPWRHCCRSHLRTENLTFGTVSHHYWCIHRYSVHLAVSYCWRLSTWLRACLVPAYLSFGFRLAYCWFVHFTWRIWEAILHSHRFQSLRKPHCSGEHSNADLCQSCQSDFVSRIAKLVSQGLHHRR